MTLKLKLTKVVRGVRRKTFLRAKNYCPWYFLHKPTHTMTSKIADLECEDSTLIISYVVDSHF
jgi:hypothetical protein